MSSSSRVGAATTTSAGATVGRRARIAVVVLLIVTGLLALAYSGLSIYVATALVYVPQLPIADTPAEYGLDYKNIQFHAREDGVVLKGWFIPGVSTDQTGTHLTADRTIIVVHGTRRNREDNDPVKGVRILDFTANLVRRGFAVLSFDMRGMGESPPAPISFGEFEQRDVLGAVDYLQKGAVPYPSLGRPRIIGGWGVSMGGATLLLAAEREPAIRSVVTDCAYTEIVPILQREVPKASGLPGFFTPGVLAAVGLLFGVNYYDARPLTDISKLSGRSALFITVSGDTFVPAKDSQELADAARAGGATVSTWLVPGGHHCNTYIMEGSAYVDRVVDFYTTALGSDAHAAASVPQVSRSAV
jgi:pimeloyl-ACP methyl ester carboxylesterase